MVGIGPGGALDRTRRAEKALRESNVIVGYKRYIDLVHDITEGKELIPGGMQREVERCRTALDRAADGETVSLISSGDAGVYGMAGLALQLAHDQYRNVEIQVIPGVTAANAAAARIGAPLMLDYACISLSDLLVDWETICRRLEAISVGDLAVALYNPRSKKRVHQFDEAIGILRRNRPATTPVCIATAVGTEEEELVLTTINEVLSQSVNMRSVVIVGSSKTTVIDGRMITPRGYPI